MYLVLEMSSANLPVAYKLNELETTFYHGSKHYESDQTVPLGTVKSESIMFVMYATMIQCTTDKQANDNYREWREMGCYLRNRSAPAVNC